MSHNYNSLPLGEYHEDDGLSGEGGSKLQFDRRRQEQDKNLEILGDSVLRLGQMSLNISEEIDSQNRTLTKLEVDVETAQDNVDGLTKRTKELVNKSGGPKMFCIIVMLIVVLLILILLVIYT